MLGIGLRISRGIGKGGQSAPVAIAATGVGETSFTANWNAYPNATYYLLDVSTSPTFNTFVYENQQVNFPLTSYTVIGLTANTTYYYRVRANVETEVFEFTINTANLSTGSSTDTQFKLPLTTSTGLDCQVYWGDGNTDNITSHTAPEVTHTYASSGTYTVKITGSILGWRFAGGGDRLKILDVKQWSGLNISENAGFQGCTNLTATATDAPFITTTNLSNYFRQCNNFNGEIGSWDMSNVTNMGLMFYFSGFNKPIGSWDMSNVTDTNNMFCGASNFNQPIGSWNTSKITQMYAMFAVTYAFDQDISTWDINQVTNFNDFMVNATGLSTTNYDLLLVGWEAQAPLTGKSVNFGGSKYTLGSAAETARASLISTYGWTITDGGGI